MSDFFNPTEEQIRKAAAMRGGLPPEFADRLKGETFSDLVEDAQRLKRIITPSLSDIARLSPDEIRSHSRDFMKQALNPFDQSRTDKPSEE